MGHLRHGMVIGLALLAGCGGLEGTEAGVQRPEDTGTVEAAVYESPDSLAGLVGTYSRTWPLAAPEELLTMTLTGTEYADRVEGSYVRTVSRTCPVLGCNTETASFYALPNNPAIGSFIAFRDLAGETRDVYSISQIQRSLFTGKITGIVLQKGVNGSQPFTMTRVGF
ncbi:hypothetical protein HUA74_18705 [Myxococcus sp. CA051A]|uniref:hypothetical protein n=2 Tax=Myxococcus TaxID=32 RepID=UPI00157B0DB5|nr:hypothetical protein [Myxococcus sp. CA051A]NTX14585.1 hypothetical protein [Myxococcus sp. CA056]NTX38755.1 hypothetical protein [Myxococcus sp. CA033]NTX62680.1 hypothetical protein [Myxococcus sp. CA051A]